MADNDLIEVSRKIATRHNLIRLLRELSRQRPGPDGDEIRRALKRLEALNG